LPLFQTGCENAGPEAERDEAIPPDRMSGLNVAQACKEEGQGESQKTGEAEIVSHLQAQGAFQNMIENAKQAAQHDQSEGGQDGGKKGAEGFKGIKAQQSPHKVSGAQRSGLAVKMTTPSLAGRGDGRLRERILLPHGS
jgi:hypothetical protein